MVLLSGFYLNCSRSARISSSCVMQAIFTLGVNNVPSHLALSSEATVSLDIDTRLTPPFEPISVSANHRMP